MFHVGEEVIGGASAGVIGTLLGFPLDLVRHVRRRYRDKLRTPNIVFLRRSDYLASLQLPGENSHTDGKAGIIRGKQGCLVIAGAYI